MTPADDDPTDEPARRFVEGCREAFAGGPVDATTEIFDAPRAPSRPAAIGGYEILAEIGRGGMGVVYRARQAGLDRDVALKVLELGPALREERIARFLREARAAARVHHENLVPIHDAGADGAFHYYSMDLVEGNSLAERLRAGPLSPREAARVVRDAARGLAAAHAAGIVHRDVKPSNLLVDREGRVLVTDFGLARELDAREALTETGAFLGTPVYMAPEQVVGDVQAVGPATDVYGLGATLLEAATGTRPRDPRTWLSHVFAPPPAPAIDSRLPRDLATILGTAMELAPSRRYPTAKELADDLDRFLELRPILARPPGPGRRLLLLARRRPGRALALAAAVLALLAVAVAGARRGLARLAADREVAEGRQWDLQGRGEEALAAYARALEDSPAHDGALRHRQDLVDRMVEDALLHLRAGRLQEADRIHSRLERGVADPGPLERRRIGELGRAIGGEEAVLETALDSAVAGALPADRKGALAHLLDLAERIERAGLEPDRTSRCRLRLAAVGRGLFRQAVVEHSFFGFARPDPFAGDRGSGPRRFDPDGRRRSEAALEELRRGLRQLLAELAGPGEAEAATGIESILEVVSDGDDWLESTGPLETLEVRMLRLRGDQWSGDQEAELRRLAAGPAARQPISLDPGFYLAEVRSPGFLPARFLLPVPPRVRIAVRLRLFAVRPMPIELVHVPAPSVDVADALEPPAGEDTPRGRDLAALAEGSARWLAPADDFLAAADELTNDRFAELVPAPPRSGWTPTGWDRGAWGSPPGEGELPVRGMSRDEAMWIADEATRRWLDPPLRARWRFALPEAERRGDRLARVERLAGSGHTLLEAILQRRDPLAWPLEVWGSVGSGRAAAAGSHAADVSIQGCRDLAGNVSEWTAGDLNDAPLPAAVGSNFRFARGEKNEAGSLGPGERRDFVGLRLVLLGDAARAPGDSAERERSDEARVNRQALALRPGQPLLALELLEEFLHDHPESVPSRLNAALLSLERQNRGRAIEHAGCVIETGAGDAVRIARRIRIWASLLQVLAGEEPDVELALADLDHVLAEPHANQSLRLGRAYLLLLAGKFEELLEDLEAVLPAMYRLARLERHLGLAAFDALRLSGDPKGDGAPLVARRLFAMNDVSGWVPVGVLVPDFEFAEATFPSGKDPARRQRERLQEALRSHLGELGRMSDSAGTILARMAELWALLGDEEEAIALANLGSRFGGGSIQPLRSRGWIECHWGDLDAASATFRSVLELDPEDGEARIGLAWIALERAARTEAAERSSHLGAAREAAAAPLVPDGELVTALVDLEEGSLDAARRALEGRTGDPASLVVLGEAESRSGDRPAALAFFNRAGEIDPSYRILVAFLIDRSDD